MVRKQTKEWQYGNSTLGSKCFDLLNALFMLLLIVITLYPLLYVLFASLSDPFRLLAHSGILFRPLGFSLRGYQLVLNNSAVWNGYAVTLFIVVVGTTCNMIASLVFAYVLSKRHAMLHGLITFLAVFTMYFNGGMIPTYMVVKNLGLLDNLWALIVPGLINTYYVIILRTAMSGVPAEMQESAALDGAGEIRILIRIMLPLIIPTIAAISLFFMVDYWNSWTSALLYIQDTKKYPLQMVLRQILINNDTANAMSASGGMYQSGEDQAAKMLLKYSTIVVSILPIICVYPFLQKYFTKGVMIGALKG